MPDSKISALPTGQFQSTDYIPFVDGASGITRKATKQDLRGSMGSQGSASTVAGATGATGNQGTQGSQGSVGVQGPQGSQGSASTAIGSPGAQGTQGSQGSQGSASTVAGPTGPTGNQGTQGSIGVQGTQGSQGSLGITGPQGTQGTKGSHGSIGLQGTQGSQGSVGATGYAVPRISSSVTGGTVTPTADTTDIREVTAQDQAIFFDTPSGTPVDGQKMIVQIKFAGTAGTISFTGSWTAGGVALPTAGVTGKYLHLGFMYVTANSFNRWLLLASAQQV